MPLLRPPGGEMSGQLTRFPTVLEPWFFFHSEPFPLALSPTQGVIKLPEHFTGGSISTEPWSTPQLPCLCWSTSPSTCQGDFSTGVCASSGCGRLLLPLWFERLNQQFWHLAAQHSLLQVSWAADNKNTQNPLIYNLKCHRKRLFRASQNAN